MARRFGETLTVSEPYFSKGKERAREEDSLCLPKLFFLPGPPSASSHMHPAQCQLQEISPAIN